LNLSSAWPNRLGFLLSSSLAIIRVVTLQQDDSASFEILSIVFSSSGALLGGLLATGLDGGLLEHNFQPSELVRLDVLQRHLEVLGKPHRKLTAKRLFDLCLSTLGLIISTPIWMLISLLIWFEDPGPLLFIKNSVGMGGENFHQLKFRTMVHGAESETGPILADENDKRILLIGHVLRKTALDELPQLINILRGDMSFVGPRPQRTVLVQGYLEEMPEFAERHKIRPGLAGLAQLVGSYYITPRQKLRFDRIYARHAGLGFDLKLIVLSFLLVFWLRWRKNWNGRLPRTWLRFGNRLQ
jgi:lipopolysaccharide/colanic/teichoic acid biosynthesis glycosyltransferase